MKKTLLSALLATSLLVGNAQAGIPVIDAGSIAQAVQQLMQLQQQYQVLQQQYKTMENQYSTLKNNISSLNLNSSSELLNQLNQLNEFKTIISNTSKLDAKTSSMDIKKESIKLNNIYKSQVNESNNRIKKNMNIIESLKGQLAGANVSDTAKLQTAINDAYSQINNEKSIQSGLTASVKTGSAFLSKKYATQKLNENATKSSIWSN